MDQLLVKCKLIITIIIYYNLVGGAIDYNVSSIHTIEVNKTSFSFNVSLIDDDIFEGNENFTLSIRTSLPIMVVEPVQTTVTIVDDDRKFMKNLIVHIRNCNIILNIIIIYKVE